MKKIIVLLLFPILLSAQGDVITKEKTDWITNYDQAIKLAKKEKKNILMFFTGSDWCPPCIALKRDFLETTAFDVYANEYILLYIDIPRNKDLLTADQLKSNKELAAKYNKRGSVPMLKVVNKEGNELGEMSGYSMNGEIKYHTKFLEKYKK
ncbi:thioredoxin family protein [Cellulophaga tyrosinoxydans]|uniref:Thioredoxin-related protein n=1 Tax=Cellulophaga tyrosinoxydans TaxID=504486 RepID=A0A1W1ZWL6_9FLAO|nr:thioredoxin family protein [Cellulophaga tyrosinoxydans]SMC52521.1 Thioredoxin-related protein [Cellulophaga tyrosinoxydans]